MAKECKLKNGLCRLSNPATRLKVCNRTLGVTMLLMLASGIQLEATSGRYVWSVWLHIALGILLIAFCLYHIYLHYKSSNWFARFSKNKNLVTRILWWVFLLTAVTGIAATALWIGNPVHTHFGAIHGKIGFLMALIAIIHVVRRRKKHRPLHRHQ